MLVHVKQVKQMAVAAIATVKMAFRVIVVHISLSGGALNSAYVPGNTGGLPTILPAAMVTGLVLIVCALLRAEPSRTQRQHSQSGAWDEQASFEKRSSRICMVNHCCGQNG